MLVNLDHKGKALCGDHEEWNIDFPALKAEVEKRAQILQSSPQPLQLRWMKMNARKETILDLLAHLQSEIPIVLFAEDLTETELKQRLQILPVPDKIHPEARVLLMTSGTTGNPKVVQLSAANIKANINAVKSSLQFAKQPHQTLFLGLSYSFGLLGQLLPALDAGVETRFAGSFLDLKPQLEEGTLSGMLSGVPGQLRLLTSLATKPNPEVTAVVSAGAYLPVDLRQKLRATFPKARITSNYGQTEASPRILSLASDQPGFDEGAVGKLVEGWQARLEGSGELAVQGPQVMLGYLNDPEATAEKVKAGWLQTGDLARIDEKGLIWILGRTDDQLKISGERFHPQEVEDAVRDILGINECYVFPLSAADEEPALALVLPETVAPWIAADVRTKIAAAVSRQKRPKQIFIAPEFPKTANGKIRRRELPAAILGWKKL